jgi:hypothetical protein
MKHNGTRSTTEPRDGLRFRSDCQLTKWGSLIGNTEDHQGIPQYRLDSLLMSGLFCTVPDDPALNGHTTTRYDENGRNNHCNCRLVILRW